MPATKYKKPIPLFDTLSELVERSLPNHITLPFADQDFNLIKDFLAQYTGSEDTFNAYRRELERLTQWAWFVANKSILSLRRADIEDFIHFCQSPPKSWIGTKKVSRFITKNGERLPNPDWRLFVVTLKKSSIKQGKTPDIKDYEFSQKAVQSLFIALSSFYNHLIREDVTDINPIAHIRQKSKFIRTRQGGRQVRRLSATQWDFVVKTAKQLAEKDPHKHERTLFILSALYLMYLRISELAESSRWQPQMRHFHQDSQGRWWFTTVGKGNKEREISVSDSMLEALKRYREQLNLSPLPSPADTSPLVPKIKGKGGITSTREIRLIVQRCFDNATQQLLAANKKEEAQSLEEATVHWLRHTGISDDLNKVGRPTPHVRDDAGHRSSATTDLYNDAELSARHSSAKKKKVT